MIDYYAVIRECIEGPPGGPIIYLAGPMESVANAGAEWRMVYENKLHTVGFRSISPNRLEKYVTDIYSINYSEIHNLKGVNLDDFRKKFRPVVHLDILAVRYSDGVLVRFNNEKSSGTHAEITDACLNGIPSFMVSSEPPQNILSWILACTEGLYPNEDLAIKAMRDYWFRSY